FEEAARLRDELKRLRETELAVVEDSDIRPMALKAKAGAYAGDKSYGAAANLPPTRARKPSLDAMGPGTDREVPMGGAVRPKGGGKPGRGWKR
ncbi:MAG: excinuclease ABC subunit UvrB, partial [Hyphomicrobiales bacterium]